MAGKKDPHLPERCGSSSPSVACIQVLQPAAVFCLFALFRFPSPHIAFLFRICSLFPPIIFVLFLFCFPPLSSDCHLSLTADVLTHSSLFDPFRSAPQPSDFTRASQRLPATRVNHESESRGGLWPYGDVRIYPRWEPPSEYCLSCSTIYFKPVTACLFWCRPH